MTRKKLRNRIIKLFSCILAGSLAVGLMSFAPFTSLNGKAQEENLIDLEQLEEEATSYNSLLSGNVGFNDYTKYGHTTKSYLEVQPDGGLMRVQYGAADNGYLVQYYDSTCALVSEKVIPDELSTWGGFYAGEKYYFIVTGEENASESNATEVIRITKYDKNWNHLGSVSLHGANTKRPFSHASLDMEESDGYLLIHTAHVMYKSTDGKNHQANMTIMVDEEELEITDSFYTVTGAYGYVSHSFNQFIKIDDGHIVTLDHGDAYPRSMVVQVYPTDVADGRFKPSMGLKLYTALSIQGSTGDNTTKASAGGLEVSSTHYISAGNSVTQNSNWSTNETRNIWISAIEKSTGKVNTYFATNYSESELGVSTPQLVDLQNDTFMVLWERANTVYYVTIDNAGLALTEVKSIPGNLSDCQPVVNGNKVVWYVWDGDSVKFYRIVFDTTAIENFVTRLYQVCLDREPDDVGKIYWVDKLKNEEVGGAEAACGYIFSKEFTEKNYCNECFVKHLYNAFMGREYDADGLNYWISEMSSGVTREEVFNKFAMSKEFGLICASYGILVGEETELPEYGTIPKGPCAGCGAEDQVTGFVKRLYNVCLDREAEADGLNYWATMLWNHKASGTKVAEQFVFSDEFLLHGFDDADFIKHLYNAYMGRDAEQAGLEYWLTEIANGTSREDVCKSFADSKEFSLICANYGIEWK